MNKKVPQDNSGYKVNKTRKCFIKVGKSGKASKRGCLSHDLNGEAVGCGRSWGAGSAEVLPMRGGQCGWSGMSRNEMDDGK